MNKYRQPIETHIKNHPVRPISEALQQQTPIIRLVTPDHDTVVPRDWSLHKAHPLTVMSTDEASTDLRSFVTSVGDRTTAMQVEAAYEFFHDQLYGAPTEVSQQRLKDLKECKAHVSHPRLIYSDDNCLVYYIFATKVCVYRKDDEKTKHTEEYFLVADNPPWEAVVTRRTFEWHNMFYNLDQDTSNRLSDIPQTAVPQMWEFTHSDRQPAGARSLPWGDNHATNPIIRTSIPVPHEVVRMDELTLIGKWDSVPKMLYDEDGDEVDFAIDAIREYGSYRKQDFEDSFYSDFSAYLQDGEPLYHKHSDGPTFTAILHAIQYNEYLGQLPQPKVSTDAGSYLKLQFYAADSDCIDVAVQLATTAGVILGDPEKHFSKYYVTEEGHTPITEVFLFLHK